MNKKNINVKKCAIITLFDNNNYGNRLQNYASQIYFRKMGFDVQTIPYVYRKKLCYLNPMYFVKKVLHLMLFFTKYEKERHKRLLTNSYRKEYISGFSNQYLTVMQDAKDYKINKEFSKKYDYFIVGSDQVWHCWKDNRHELEYFFLRFAEFSQRITIAPSFGFDEFPPKYLETYKEGLEGFEYISVREERGAELVNELTGKEATVLLDPTMLIDTSEWMKILRKPSQYVDDKYILVYVLGGLNNDVKGRIYKLADNLKLQVIEIMDINSDYYSRTRPDDFLYWIHNARLVVTDSFHACVFSILFQKPFVCFKRLDYLEMGNRLDTLLNKFGIKGRDFEELKDGFDYSGEVRDRLFAVDYSKVPSVLEIERKKAEEFYKMCFHDEIRN